jgi:putative nucleotidyltransferase with HDIG domain
MSFPDRKSSEDLLKTYIKNEALLHHCYMVAQAMESYAKTLDQDVELWYTTGLLHDVDWEQFPDEHPIKAVTEFFGEYPEEMKQAILAHAPGRTKVQAESVLDRYLFACDELSGLMNAVSLMRPNGFTDMQVKSVKKKIKDKSFAANVSREDIQQGFLLINKTPDEHIEFLINVFRS